MRTSTFIAATALGLIVAGTTGARAADAPAFCADPANVDRPVEKEAFAEEVLISRSVPAVVQYRLEAWRASHPTESEGYAGLTSKQALVLFGPQLCRTMSCTEGEYEKLTLASLAYASLLKDDENLVFTGDRKPARFLLDPASSVRCTRAANKKLKLVTASPGAGTETVGTGSRTALRIRGSAEDLIFPQGSSAFTDASKATISFEDDQESDTQGTKLVAAIGYSILFPGRPNADKSARFSWGMIPYVAYNIDTSKSTDEPRSVSSDIVEFGTTLQLLLDTYDRDSGLAAGNYLAITPRYLANRDDGSRLFGVGALWRPTLSPTPDFGINAYRVIKGAPLRWEIIADARFAYGNFLKNGMRPAEDARNFTRLGTRYGLGLASTIDALPLEVVVTDTRMFAISGSPRDLSRFAATLSLFFDEERRFGVEAAYRNGRANDLEEKADKWSIGLAVRY